MQQISNLNLDPEAQRMMLERCLESYENRLSIRNKKKRFDVFQANNRINTDGLCMDQDPHEVIKTLENFFQRWDKEGDKLPIKNMNLLLSGPPGTGKTEFAKYIAKTLDKDLIVKTASDLQSPWLGIAEKNIARAFSEAEEDRAILFIDEADSFLWSRGRAQRSWEVSQTNEFLCQMEGFRGVLICASNFSDLFDEAAVRRFNLKVRFDWLKPEGKLIFFHRVLNELLPQGMELTSEQQKRLQAVPMLAPGDFKVAYQKYTLMSKEDLSVEMIIDALEKETSYKRDKQRRKVGYES